jgi:hypothetical protein
MITEYFLANFQGTSKYYPSVGTVESKWQWDIETEKFWDFER